MASEQISRRENTTTEREVHIEKDQVPKMTTHFEHLAEQVKEGSDTPQGSIQELQGGEYKKEHGGRAIGDVGGIGKARETHELGAHFESLADKVKGEKEEKKESLAAKAGNTVPSSNVGKLEVKAEENKGSAGEARTIDKSELESRTRVVNTGRPTESGMQKQSTESQGQVEAEKGRRGSQGHVEAEKGRKESQGQVETEIGRNLENREETRIRGGAIEEKMEKGIENKGEVKGTVGVETQGTTAVITCTFEGGEKEERGRDARELEAAKEIASREEEREEGGDQEEESQSTLEEISKYRGQVQENTMEAIRAAQERYEKAKQATSETVGSTTQAAQDKASKAKDIAKEKAAKAKDIAMEKAAQAAEKAAQAKDVTLDKAAQAKDVTVEKAAQAKDVTLKKGQQGYATAKDTISSTTQMASDYTSQATGKAKSAGSTTGQYVGEKAVQAKDVTLETGKTATEYAGKLAADLKDKATVVGWKAAHYSTEKTVEGTKAATNIVQGTAGYAVNKATEIASKSLGAVKGLAAAAGENAKDYTARKKEEAEREYETKRTSRQQETGWRSSSKPAEQEQGQEESFQEGGGQSQKGAGRRTKEGGGIGETISQYAQSMKPTGETVGNVAQTMKKSLDISTQGGNEVIGAVGETVGEIGETMIKPAEKAQGGQAAIGVFNAIGETISEIAQTTKAIVVGDEEIESGSKQSIGSEFGSTTDHGNQGQGGFKYEERKRETFEARKT